MIIIIILLNILEHILPFDLHRNTETNSLIPLKHINENSSLFAKQRA